MCHVAENVASVCRQAEFFITHFVVFPAQQLATGTGSFGGSNAPTFLGT